MKECNLLRFFDIFFSFIALFFLIPIFIIVIPLLLLTGEKKIFYRQKRVGRDNQYFYLLKFATMLENSPSIGTKTLTVKNDPRILPFGHYLRKTKINELPQILNIIKGDMSIIGPRPLTFEAFNSYPSKFKKILLSVKPGLSGVGSIVFRNEEDMLSNNISKNFFYKNIMPYKGELEVWFVYNQSLKLYFKLIFLTVIILFYSRSDVTFKFLKGIPLPRKNIKFFFE